MSTTSKQMDRQTKILKIKEDKISGLPDDLIHYILSPFESKFVVRTSVLSKRWKLLWTTHPYLSFNNSVTFIDKFLSSRNNDSGINKLKLSFGHIAPTNKVDEFISYGISHKVQVLSVDLLGLGATVKFSTFTSTFVTNLMLNLNFRRFTESECWNLPELTTLHLIHHLQKPCKLPESYLICLPSLQTLFLDHFELPESISLSALKTLHLRRCNLDKVIWDLPALLTLNLNDVVFPDEDTRDFFSALVNLRELNLVFRKHIIHDWIINCPGLQDLNIMAQMSDTGPHDGQIVVLSRKIRNFCSVGYFPITFEDSVLKHADIKLQDKQTSALMANEETYYSQVTDMFKGLGSARTLTLDLETINVLSDVLDSFDDYPPSPFHNLKYVRIPLVCKESSMSAYLKSYLLDHSPKATIVTAFPKKMIPHIEAASVTAQNVVIEETMSRPTKVFVDSENIPECGSRVQEEHAVQNSEVHVDRVRRVDDLVKGTCNDQASSLRGTCDSGLWRGYAVNTENVGLLDQIMSKYPQTFQHLTTKNNKFYKMKLEMLCTVVIDFTTIPLIEVDAKVIADYRDIFADLQKLGFDVSWLVNRLNSIEELHVSEKMQQIQKPVETMGTSHIVDYIGYNLLSGP